MKNPHELGSEKVWRLLLRFSVPAIVGMLVQALYNVVDRIFIGQGVGMLGIAGITVSFPVMLVIMAVGMLIGIGATSLVSIRLGEQKSKEAGEIASHAFVLLVLTAIGLSVLGLVFLQPLLRIMGASEAILPYASDYLGIILWGTVFSSIGFGMNNVIRAEGQPKISMITMLIGALLNIALDPLFIFVFGWGIRGAAAATVISQFVSAAWVMWFYISGRSALKFRLIGFPWDWNVVRSIAVIGFAPFAMQIAASLLNVLLNNSLLAYGGDVAISGMGVLHSVLMLILMPVFGINQGVQPIIGYNYGAKKYERSREAVYLGCAAATVIVLLGYFSTRLFPEQIIMLFNRDDPELLAFSVRALRIFLFFLPLVGYQIVGASYFQAVGKAKQAMLLSLSRQVLILLPLILILPRFFGLDGILMAGPIADVSSATLTTILLAREWKEHHRLTLLEPQTVQA